MRSCSLLFGLLLLLGCTEVTPEPEECLLEADSWAPGELAFEEATEEWGLSAVRGLRVSATDIDGDHWPDLLVRRGGGPDDFSEGGVRNRWLLRNLGGSFEDVTEASGLFRGRLDNLPGSRPAEVLASGDVDNDGDLDIFTALGRSDITEAAEETSELMLNQGDGTFRLADNNNHFLDLLSVPVGASLLDANLDGFLDVFISNNKRGQDNSPLQDRLLVGLGDGLFDEQTEDLGLGSSQWNSIDTLNDAEGHTWGWGATSCDLNNDGLPEILSASYGRAPNHLWQARNEEAGISFRNRSVESGYAFDHRDDWTTNINAQCYCADHPSAEDCDLAPEPEDYGQCENLAAAFGSNYRWNHSGDREAWRLGGNSATTTCADLNNDGWLDLFTGEIVHGDVGETSDPAEILFNARDDEVIRLERPGNSTLGLLRGDEDGIYWDHGDMNNTILDFDNDGLQDVYLSSSDYPGTRGWLFHQQPGGDFELVDMEDAIDHTRSAGVVAMDIDRDGDLDLVVGHSRMRCSGNMGSDCYDEPYVRGFENLADQRNDWLQLRLEGSGGSNRSAIGARVTIGRCEQTLTRSVDGGHGHVGTQEDPVLHFGVGFLDEAEVTVHWPDMEGTSETYSLSTNTTWLLRQGDGAEAWTP
ncbi:MAG: CRTAC1 family protein [Myxococcota bacterium]|nr:CRTAC1 family protein [Myxococcota bacterium]